MQEVRMTKTKAFYQMLDDLAVLFDVENTHGGNAAADALRSITSKSHLPLPRGHDILPDVEKQALDIDPLPICEHIEHAMPLIDWHHSGLADGRIRPEIANKMATVELIGPDGMIFHDTVRVGLFMQSANLDYVTREHAAEETFIMLCGSGMWSCHNEPLQTRKSGDYIHHPSMAPHVSVTYGDPFIAAWRWTGEIGYDKYSLTG
jgi:hypothetical protein